MSSDLAVSKSKDVVCLVVGPTIAHPPMAKHYEFGRQEVLHNRKNVLRTGKALRARWGIIENIIENTIIEVCWKCLEFM